MIEQNSMRRSIKLFPAGTASRYLRALSCGLLAILALINFPVAAAPYYGNTPTTFSWIDPVAGGHTAAIWTSGASCTGGTYVNAPGDDDITAQIPIGFNFNFGGVAYGTLQIMANGRLQFNNGYCGWGTWTVGPPPTYPYDFPTGNPGGGNVVRMMRIYGADFDPGASAPGGRVYYTTTGIAPNRNFIVTFYNIKEWNSPGSLFNMQVILRENGEFVYQYKDTVNVTTGHAQIGWEISAADYDIYNYSGFGSLAYSAIRYYPAPVKTGEWRMDELSWIGAAGEVLDTSGNNRNGQAVNGAVTASASPAISTNPGTCRYGVFDGANDHVLLPGTFPNLNQSFTITAWINTRDRTRSGQRVFIDDETNSGYGLSLGDGGAGVLSFYSRTTAPVSLDTPAVIQDNLWYFVAAVADIAGLSKTIYVYDASGALLTSVTAAFAGAWGTDAGAASIGGETSASAESALKFFGNLDEVKVLSGAVPQSTLDILARETHLCPITGATLGGFNVFESSTPAGYVAGYIKTKVAGRRFDLSTGNLAIVALTPADAIDAAFTGAVKVELLNASAGGALDANGCNGAWPVVATLANQNVSDGRVNMNPIPQVNAAAYQNLKVRVSYPAVGAVTRYGCSNDAFALRPDSLVMNNATHLDWENPGVASALNNLGVAGGQVHKAGRNFSLSATARDALGAGIGSYAGSPAAGVSALQLPSGCGACVPGTVTVGGWAGTGTVVSNSATYSEAGAITMHLEDRSFANIDAADSSTGERYIDSNPVGVGRFVPDHFDLATAVAPIFRTFNTTDAACSAGAAPRRTFTYIGQLFGYATMPQATIIARNFANATTANYRGALWKLGSGAGAAIAPVCTSATCTLNSSLGTTTFSNAYTFTLNPAVATGWDTALPVTGTPSVASNNDGTGTLSFTSSDQLAFNRPLAPLADFTATINSSIGLTDASEGAGQTILTANPAVFGAITFDASYVGPPAQPNRFFYGRLRLANANGSELLPLSMRMTTQYFTAAAGFVDNTLDNCTTIANANVGLGNYQINLNDPETGASMTVTPFVSGVKNLTLSAPGANNYGSADVVVNLGTTTTPSVCPLFWSGPAPTPAGANLTHLRDARICAPGVYDKDPTARATFGAYDVNRNFIYLRENY